jgi:hypothetical protein
VKFRYFCTLGEFLARVGASEQPIMVERVMKQGRCSTAAARVVVIGDVAVSPASRNLAGESRGTRVAARALDAAGPNARED